jgi:hypothetical protein
LKNGKAVPGKSPFKDNKELQDSISKFLSLHGAIFIQNAKKTSAFFELAVYNDLVKFYERAGYEVRPWNLLGPLKAFIYALSTNAKPKNCSYFTVTRRYQNGDQRTFEVRHNLRVQSAHDEDVFFSPDYAVVDAESVKSKKLPFYYNGKADYYYVESGSVRTFAETKHYNPGPELVLNFIGLVNEAMPNCLNGSTSRSRPKHFAPALFVSGVGSTHVQKIKWSLGTRYDVNIFLGLFAYPSQLYSSSNQTNVKKIGT